MKIFQDENLSTLRLTFRTTGSGSRLMEAKEPILTQAGSVLLPCTTKSMEATTTTTSPTLFLFLDYFWRHDHGGWQCVDAMHIQIMGSYYIQWYISPFGNVLLPCTTMPMATTKTFGPRILTTQMHCSVLQSCRLYNEVDSNNSNHFVFFHVHLYLWCKRSKSGLNFFGNCL